MAAVALGVAAPVSAATYTVSPSGSDSNNGVSAPFQTLSKAVGVARDGDTVLLRAGTYAGGVSLRGAVTLESYPGEVATISTPADGSVATTVAVSTSAIGVRLRRLKIVGGSYYSLKIDGDKRDKNTLVEDCVIGQSGRDCVKLTPGADGVTFRRCEIGFSGLRDPSNAEGIDNVCADRMVVQDCWIHDTATNGIYPKGGAREALIERTRLENCGGGAIMLGFWTDTEWFDQTENPRMFENLNSMVRNCVIVNAKGAGIGIYSAQNAQVYNNTLVNVGQSVHPAIILSLGNTTTPSENFRFVNNVVVQPGSATQPMVGVRSGGYSGPVYWSNNCYSKTGSQPVFDDAGWKGDFRAWQSRINSDANSMAGDPSLDAAGVPKAGSPCIDHGFALTQVSDDFRGTLRNGTPDVGAFEQAGGETAPQAPTNVTATPATLRVDVSWSGVALAQGYRVYRGTSQAGTYSRLTTNTQASTAFTDTAVSQGSTYWYRVTSVSATGVESAPSTPVSATVAADTSGEPPVDPPAEQPTGTVVVYDDRIRSGWAPSQYRATASLAVGNPVGQGSAAIALTIKKADGFLTLSGSGVATAGKTSLRFLLHGGKRGDQALRVRALVNGQQQASVNLWSYGGRPLAGKWVEVVVPLADLGATSGQITGIKFSAGKPQAVAYLDHIVLQ